LGFFDLAAPAGHCDCLLMYCWEIPGRRQKLEYRLRLGVAVGLTEPILKKRDSLSRESASASWVRYYWNTWHSV